MSCCYYQIETEFLPGRRSGYSPIHSLFSHSRKLLAKCCLGTYFVQTHRENHSDGLSSFPVQDYSCGCTLEDEVQRRELGTVGAAFFSVNYFRVIRVEKWEVSVEVRKIHEAHDMTFCIRPAGTADLQDGTDWPVQELLTFVTMVQGSATLPFPFLLRGDGANVPDSEAVCRQALPS